MSVSTPSKSRRLSAISLCLALGIGVALAVQSQRDPHAFGSALSRFPLARDFVDVAPTTPPGMAPSAFSAYLRACERANVNPQRIGQTVGDAPESVGYHKCDGVLNVNGERVEYSAAVDLSVGGLSEFQIARWCAALTNEGFAPFYRHKGKWRNKRHIHAIYGALKMKPQLQRQTRDFLRERRKNGLPKLKWEKQFRALN